MSGFPHATLTSATPGPAPVMPSLAASRDAFALPQRGGIGLKPEYFQPLLANRPALGFVEIHAENYMVEGGPFHHYLGLIRQHYALSVHGVGLSIGGEEPLSRAHLERLRKLLNRYEPESFSEHLAWSSQGPCFLDDLLPLVYDRQTLQRVCDHIDQVQDYLQRRILLENPATYLQFADSQLAESEFIAEVVQRSGCGLLLDINNIYVTCSNHGLDAVQYLHALPLQAVGEIHLAGFSIDNANSTTPLLIDSHAAPVAEPVWQLYQQALERTGPVAVLIERDNALPPLEELLAEAVRAEQLLFQVARWQAVAP